MGNARSRKVQNFSANSEKRSDKVYKFQNKPAKSEDLGGDIQIEDVVADQTLNDTEQLIQRNQSDLSENKEKSPARDQLQDLN